MRETPIGKVSDGLRRALTAEEARDKAKGAPSPHVSLVGGPFAKVREIVFGAEGLVNEKYALDWKTGGWRHIEEGEIYPSECYQEIELVCCSTFRAMLTGNDNCRDGSWWLRIKGNTLLGSIHYCPVCGRKLSLPFD